MCMLYTTTIYTLPNANLPFIISASLSISIVSVTLFLLAMLSISSVGLSVWKSVLWNGYSTRFNAFKSDIHVYGVLEMVTVHGLMSLNLETVLGETFSLQQQTVLKVPSVWHGFVPAQLPDDSVTSPLRLSLLLLAYHWYVLTLVFDQSALYQKPAC